MKHGSSLELLQGYSLGTHVWDQQKWSPRRRSQGRKLAVLLADLKYQESLHWLPLLQSCPSCPGWHRIWGDWERWQLSYREEGEPPWGPLEEQLLKEIRETLRLPPGRDFKYRVPPSSTPHQKRRWAGCRPEYGRRLEVPNRLLNIQEWFFISLFPQL